MLLKEKDALPFIVHNWMSLNNTELWLISCVMHFLLELNFSMHVECINVYIFIYLQKLLKVNFVIELKFSVLCI